MGELDDPLPPLRGNYAHHPPLTNFAQIAVAGALGQDEWQIRLFGYLNGLATLVLIPVLLRDSPSLGGLPRCWPPGPWR